MTAKQLRAIVTRYGNAGALFVGAYMLLHHVWRHRRPQLVVAVGGLLAVSGWMLHRHAPVHNLKRPAAKSVVSAPPPAAPRLHLSLQDDTAPVPFPASDGKGPFLSDGAIFFSANFYHWSGQFYQSEYGGAKRETLAGNDDTDHLFRLTRGQTHPQPLTFGEANDRNPTLSPDGRQLAFLREKGERSSLCLVSTRGGPVLTLLRLPKDFPCFQLTWSPNGRWFALHSRTYDAAYEEKNTLLLFRPDRRDTLHIDGIKEAVWSPDSRLYLRTTTGKASIFHPDTHSSVSLKAVVHHAVWLDSHTLAGDTPIENDTFENSGLLRIIDDHGRQLRESSLKLIGKTNEYATFDNQHIWHCWPHHPETVLLETWRFMSDGEHFGCFRVDLRTGQARLVADGTLIGIAPDGSRVAVAENAWVGPYKGGGARVGALKIVSPATGRADSVTDPLSCLNEGVWQSSSTRSFHTYANPLLESVSQGDPAMVRVLLAGGANPNTSAPNGETALMIAASDGNRKMVQLLLQHGVQVDQTDRKGNTALMYTFGAEKMSNEMETSTQIAITQLLLQAGADIHASNHHGFTTLMLAARNGRAVAADWLLKQGAHPNACSKAGSTALMLAAFEDYSHTVQVLLDAHAAVNVKDKDGGTALSSVHLQDESHPETITLLRQAGATPSPE